jgi:hypothetical protein
VQEACATAHTGAGLSRAAGTTRLLRPAGNIQTSTTGCVLVPGSSRNERNCPVRPPSSPQRLKAASSSSRSAATAASSRDLPFRRVAARHRERGDGWAARPLRSGGPFTLVGRDQARPRPAAPVR